MQRDILRYYLITSNAMLDGSGKDVSLPNDSLDIFDIIVY